MNTMSTNKKITITAVCIALCCILPPAFHAFGIGAVFSPLHIPVLLCGLICGSGYGLFCGIAGPVLSSILTSMPSAARLTYFIPELMVYGFVTGLMMKLVHTKKLVPDIYIALVAAMLAGRIVGGIAQALFYLGSGKAFSLAAIASAYFVSALPGILCHLIVIPLLVVTLMKARLIPSRYLKEV